MTTSLTSLAKDSEVDIEVASLYREYQFRKTFGGSHDDFLNQPRNVTDWLIAINNTMNEVQRG